MLCETLWASLSTVLVAQAGTQTKVCAGILFKSMRINLLFLLIVFSAASVTVGQCSDRPARPATWIEEELSGMMWLCEPELLGLERVSARVSDSGVAFSYEGVLLSELIKIGENAFGGDLDGRPVSTFHLVEEGDGKYLGLRGLPDLNPNLETGVNFLADTRNGLPIPTVSGKIGRVRLIYENESQSSLERQQGISITIVVGHNGYSRLF